ncbi:Smr/MutS family protein [Amaricoccus sp.]|uniref:Smr/MutS family protein n=1 Tax=Amaricoccus sp. TaxID=1872485 RepID=UPI001B539764|nr:Smr/MutS family protein [Amaricoccus sp.]MBP7002416.1 Smr/MutS family protein [Amaricoccus sp.]
MPRRRLSPEEAELWRRVAETTVPLRPAAAAGALAEAALPDPVVPVPVPVAAAAPPRLALRPRKPAAEPLVRVDLAADPHGALAEAGPHMDRRRFERLRRGRMEPEARLDLHGMTLERAHGALTGFILGAQASGLRLVLVITGKGREGDPLAPHRRGALRHAAPHWLAAPPLGGKVLQVAPAHFRHGGGGAYYVYLRRNR